MWLCRLLNDVLVTSPGTIRTCQKFLIQYNTTQLLRLLQNCTNEGEFLQPLSQNVASIPGVVVEDAELLLNLGLINVCLRSGEWSSVCEEIKS